MKYVKYIDLENLQRDYLKQTGRYLAVSDAIRNLVRDGKYTEQDPSYPRDIVYDRENFMKAVENSLIPVRVSVTQKTEDSSLIPGNFDLFTFKELKYSPQNMHPHSCFDLIYQYRGESVLHYDQLQQTIHEGEMILLGPMSSYMIEKDPESSIIITTYIRQKMMNRSFFDVISTDGIIAGFIRNILLDIDDPNFIILKGNNVSEMQRIVQKMFIETNYPDPHSPKAAVYWARLLFINAARSFEFLNSFRSIDQKDTRVFEILDYINNHFQTVSMKELASEFGYNESYLSTLFSEKTGQSFSDYIVHLKIGKAREYLKNTDYTNERIAMLCGYTSADHFTRRFKKTEGITPGEYRRRCHEQ